MFSGLRKNVSGLRKKTIDGVKGRVKNIAKAAGDTRAGKAAKITARAATAAGATFLLGPLAAVMGPLLGLTAFAQTLMFVGMHARTDSIKAKATAGGLLAAGAAFSAVIGIVLPAILNAILPILIAAAAAGSVAKDTNVLDKISSLKTNIVEKIKAKLSSIKNRAADGEEINREDGIVAAKEVFRDIVTEVKPRDEAEMRRLEALDIDAEVAKKEAEIVAETNKYTGEVDINNIDNLDNTIEAKNNEIKNIEKSRFGKIIDRIKKFFSRRKSEPSASVVVNAQPLQAQPLQAQPLQDNSTPMVMAMPVKGGRRRTKKRRGGKRKRRRKTKRKGRKKTKKRRKLKKRKTKKRR